MKNNTQRNGIQQGSVSQYKTLSFYEENYILEPEDFEKDNGYFVYESDDSNDVIYLGDSYQFAI
ncbi:hypothetical protein [Flavobacterium wongokense]|uniref:hypothetical protein n=1 Tax=Flavobacterium wongokense TaxID=2910674 RepID=UPI001F4097D5|nr:hypothetical protein [Flavobacterium sp. WG47]MCF6132512.1 hypothetical protein [Flavobacterium sp. WG47]